MIAIIGGYKLAIASSKQGIYIEGGKRGATPVCVFGSFRTVCSTVVGVSLHLPPSAAIVAVDDEGCCS